MANLTHLLYWAKAFPWAQRYEVSCSTARGLVTLSRFKPRITDIGAGRVCVKPDWKAGFTVKQNPRVYGSLCQDHDFTFPSQCVSRQPEGTLSVVYAYLRCTPKRRFYSRARDQQLDLGLDRNLLIKPLHFETSMSFSGLLGLANVIKPKVWHWDLDMTLDRNN